MRRRGSDNIGRNRSWRRGLRSGGKSGSGWKSRRSNCCCCGQSRGALSTTSGDLLSSNVASTGNSKSSSFRSISGKTHQLHGQTVTFHSGGSSIEVQNLVFSGNLEVGIDDAGAERETSVCLPEKGETPVLHVAGIGYLEAESCHLNGSGASRVRAIRSDEHERSVLVVSLEVERSRSEGS